MCVVVAIPKGVTHPTREEFTKMAEANRHGIGVGWMDPTGEVAVWEKAIPLKRLFHILDTRKNTAFLIHFRLASIGAKTAGLCHPFPIMAGVPLQVKGKAPAVLAHNGHWSKWDDVMQEAVVRHRFPIPNDNEWSDSRAMAWLAHYFGHGILSTLNEKVAVLNPKKKHILLYGGGWQSDQDVYYSNFLWRSAGTIYPAGGYTDGWKHADKEWWEQYGARRFMKEQSIKNEKKDEPVKPVTSLVPVEDKPKVPASTGTLALASCAGTMPPAPCGTPHSGGATLPDTPMANGLDHNANGHAGL